MMHTTFPNEEVLLEIGNGKSLEILVTVAMPHENNKRAYVAIKNGTFVDYPILSGYCSLWDTPERWSARFRGAVTKLMIERNK